MQELSFPILRGFRPRYYRSRFDGGILRGDYMKDRLFWYVEQADASVNVKPVQGQNQRDAAIKIAQKAIKSEGVVNEILIACFDVEAVAHKNITNCECNPQVLIWLGRDEWKDVTDIVRNSANIDLVDYFTRAEYRWEVDLMGVILADRNHTWQNSERRAFNAASKRVQ